MTSDPYEASAGPGEPGSWNRSAYVQGDPVNFGDPAGLAKCSAVSTTWATPPSSQEMTTTLEISCMTTAGQDGKAMTILPGNASAEEISSALAQVERDTQAAEDDQFNDLLKASQARVKGYLVKPSCQKDYRNLDNTNKKLGAVMFGDLGPGGKDMTIGYSVPFMPIKLNSRLNWANPG